MAEPEAQPKKVAGLDKVAILLTTLGPEAAAAVLRQLDEMEIRQVSQAIARLRSIPKLSAKAPRMSSRAYGFFFCIIMLLVPQNRSGISIYPLPGILL